MTAPFVLTDEEGRLLARVAHDAVCARVRRGQVPVVADPPAAFDARLGAFVTVESPAGNLRGCFGNVEPSGRLIDEIPLLATEAATTDRRFEPVRVGDLERLHVKVSVLSPMERLDAASPDDLLRRLRPRQDGVLLELPGARARSVYLPEVWEKLDDDPVVFLGSLSEKQGAAAGAWRSEFRAARFWTFRTRAWST
ncbi:MAG: AMMECR1 domain-containing protein [Planctomycetes bacterium]|nr:AMMECR1 domain-containing protein [Planctomycetota bacterium]